VLKAVADAAARTKANVAKAAPNEMFERVKALRKERIAFIESYKEGESRPFPEVVKNWENYQKEVSDLTALYSSFQKIEDADEKAKIVDIIHKDIQDVGSLLRTADHGVYANPPLSAETQLELKNYVNEFNEFPSALDENYKLNLVSPDQQYTLKYLPVPIVFDAPAGTPIILRAEAGGLFPNGLPYIKITADDTGKAATYWSSKGSGVGICSILFRSPEYPGKGHIQAVVKKLDLLPLDVISPLAKISEDKAAKVIEEAKKAKSNDLLNR